MATLVLLAWFYLAVSSVLAVLCVRGQRRALARLAEEGTALHTRVANQEAVIGRLADAVAAFAPLAMEDETSKRSAPAESTTRPRTEPPPASAEGRAPDTERVAPVEVRRDEHRTVEVHRVANDTRAPVEEEPESAEEARVRQLLVRLPFSAHSPMTLAQYIREKQIAILDEEKHPNVKHCEGASCFPGAWSVCGCPCLSCKARRHALSLALHLFGLPIVRLPGEKRAAWDLRRRAHEKQPETVVLPPSSHVVACMASVSISRADALFWAKLDRAIQDGVDVKHCRGPECDPFQATCSCSCTPCDRRRTLAERAAYEYPGRRSGGAHEGTLAARAHHRTLARPAGGVGGERAARHALRRGSVRRRSGDAVRVQLRRVRARRHAPHARGARSARRRGVDDASTQNRPPARSRRGPTGRRNDRAPRCAPAALHTPRASPDALRRLARGDPRWAQCRGATCGPVGSRAMGRGRDAPPAKLVALAADRCGP